MAQCNYRRLPYAAVHILIKISSLSYKQEVWFWKELLNNCVLVRRHVSPIRISGQYDSAPRTAPSPSPPDTLPNPQVSDNISQIIPEYKRCFSPYISQNTPSESWEARKHMLPPKFISLQSWYSFINYQRTQLTIVLKVFFKANIYTFLNWSCPPHPDKNLGQVGEKDKFFLLLLTWLKV